MAEYADYLAAHRASRLADNVKQAMTTGCPKAYAAVDAILRPRTDA